MTEDQLEGGYAPAQAPRRGWLFRLLWPATSYLVTNVTVTFLGVLLFLFNRTTVLGRRNVGEQPNTLLLCNPIEARKFPRGMGAFSPFLAQTHLIQWNRVGREFTGLRSRVVADKGSASGAKARDLHALHR